jgi:cytochrome c-type biogenesis protein CcmH/NrfG
MSEAGAASREPMLYAVAGIAFGFVLGYMVANAGDDAPTSVPVASVATAPSGAAPAPGAARGAALDPNEVSALEGLASRDPKNARVRVELGNLNMDHERWADAVKWYQAALALEPKNADVRVDMGACLVSLGRAPEAIAAFDAAIADQPGHKKALFNKGIALMQSGRPKEAVALWEDLLKRYPDDPQLAPLRQQIAEVRASANLPR